MGLTPLPQLLALLAELMLVVLAAAVPRLSRKSETAAAEDWVPLSAPPEVLTQTSFRVSGLCQKLGSTSITT